MVKQYYGDSRSRISSSTIKDEGIRLMGGKKEMIKQGQSSKKKNEGSYFSDGEKSRSRKNVFTLKNSDKQVKKKMQRILEGELEGIEDDDLYE